MSDINQNLVEKDNIDVEYQRCCEALEYAFKYQGSDACAKLMTRLNQHVSGLGVNNINHFESAYINSIPPQEEIEYPGDIEIEQRIKSIIRWNAMAMVVRANRANSTLGGHISSFASSATLYEVGFNHFFKGRIGDSAADQIYYQGHVTPGIYARAYVEGRLKKEYLYNFRQELNDTGGLSSYPHPYLMPDFWQFPTVSMGLGPIMAIYQARFNRYLTARKLIKEDNSIVWSFMGDGECDEPESLGALTMASRENLDNLIFVVNCNLQRLDGPVRGNGKIIQELESMFKGAGWHVVKLIWGSNWDPIIYSKHQKLLLKRFSEVVDGDFQKYSVEPGSYTRKHFFGKYPELLELVDHMTDKDIEKLLRGGHDVKKVYAAYKEAVEYKGKPVVVLAKTIKGYGLGEAGEGKNISHQQKKLNEKELREFRERFDIPLNDEDVVEAPFYPLKKTSEEYKYMTDQRKKLGGFIPTRTSNATPLAVPELSFFDKFLGGSNGRELSTTMAFVRMLSQLLKDKEIGKLIVPIIPDEARTFGMESLFREIGIYSSKGQLYEPVDSESLLYYKETTDGQILEEGINEAGAMSSFIAAGTSYSVHNQNLIPFFIYYSMFGFQRIGDLIWAAGDMGTKGFLLGGTHGRTTLNGEGLQHQDGHSLLLASTIPNLLAYDISFGFELAVILQDGMKRMYADNEEIFYYLTLHNENYEMLPMPKGAEEGIKKGIYLFQKPQIKSKHYVNLFGSGAIMNQVLKAATILEDEYGVGAKIWGVTSYKSLRVEALEVERKNRLEVTDKYESYIESLFSNEKEPIIAASDNMKIIPEQISKWLPNGLCSLGTDGFGRSDTREKLRDFFEVDAKHIVFAALNELYRVKKFDQKKLIAAKKKLGINSKKKHPVLIA